MQLCYEIPTKIMRTVRAPELQPGQHTERFVTGLQNSEDAPGTSNTTRLAAHLKNDTCARKSARKGNNMPSTCNFSRLAKKQGHAACQRARALTHSSLALQWRHAPKTTSMAARGTPAGQQQSYPCPGHAWSNCETKTSNREHQFA